MHRAVRVPLVLALAALTGAAASRAPEALAELDAFRIEHVTVQGTRFLQEDEVLSALDVSARASVWDDPTPWERRLEAHPMIRDARIGRRLPSTLVIEVAERTPVALLATPTLEPVDSEGRRLPVDPAAHGLDLPLIQLPTDRIEDRGGSADRFLRLLAGEADRLARLDPDVAGWLSELTWNGGHVLARWGSPSVDLLFDPPLRRGRLERAMAVLADARRRRPDRRVEAVDLRFEDQVVVRYAVRPSLTRTEL